MSRLGWIAASADCPRLRGRPAIEVCSPQRRRPVVNTRLHQVFMCSPSRGSNGQPPSEKSPLLQERSNGWYSARSCTSQSKVDPRTRASFLSRLTFTYLAPLFNRQQSETLQYSDLYEAPEFLTAEYNAPRMYKAWDDEVARNPSSPSLVHALLRSGCIRKFFLAAPIKIAFDVAVLVTPVVFEKIISWFDSQQPAAVGTAWVLALFALSVLAYGILLPSYFYLCSCTGMRANRSVALLLQRKALRLSSSGKGSSGELVSLLSVDAKTVDADAFNDLHLMWSAPLQVIVCVVLLYRLLGPASLFGVAVMVLSTVLANFQCKLFSDYLEKKMEVSDERLRALSEVLSICRQIKMFAWEFLFERRVKQLRAEQMSWSWKANVTDAFGWALWDSVPTMVSLVTFAFASSSMLPFAPRLIPAVVFPALALMDIIRFPLTIAPEVLQAIVTARVSLRRITKFLLAPEASGRLQDPLDDGLTRAAGFENGLVFWEQANPVLRDIELNFPRGRLTIITGPVGSGKTSMLAALLGEMKWARSSERRCGPPRMNGALVSYAPQSSWIFSGSVRDNIIFMDDTAVDEHRYRQVLHACALTEDLKIMTAGDQTEVGSRGVTLSGGQRARVALARAVYARAPAYLFDSTLSALDAHMSQQVFERVLGRNGLLAGETRILVTHSLDLCPYADCVIYIDNGRVSDVTYPSSSDIPPVPPVSTAEYGGRATTAASQSRMSDGLGHAKKAWDISLSANDEVKSTSSSAPRDVLWYIFFAGSTLPVLCLVSIFVSQAFVLLADAVLAQWSRAVSNDLTSSGSAGNLSIASQFMLPLIVVSVFACVTQLGKQLLASYVGLRIAEDMHNSMLASILRAPVSFFDETPVGRLVNRFGGDISSIDYSLPVHLTAAITYSALTCLMAILILGITPLAVILTVPLAVMYYLFAKKFTKVKRELQHLQSASESPLYSSFQESLDGMVVIRAFGRTQLQEQAFGEALDANTKALALATFANRYLGVRVAVMGAVSIATVAGAAIAARSWLSPALAGLSLLWAFKLASPLRWLPSVFSIVETGFVASDRIHHYVSFIPQEAARKTDMDDELNRRGWPAHGKVVFKDVCLRYRAHLPLALRSMSLSVPGGKRIGICGRSGSGKSTMMAAMLRMVELESGSIEIDGVNIRGVGLQTLRSRIAVIPQEPALFRGTVRENIDPEGRVSDGEIWEALDRAEITSRVHEIGGLDGIIHDSGENMSAGERQLLALARSLCQRSRIIVMDEASSNLDWETDAKIVKTMREELRDATVFIIAHRLRTIVDCDYVVVVDNGEIVEGPESPSVLLGTPASRFAGLSRELGSGTREELRRLASGFGRE